jgi:hypothetical protein
MSANPQETNSTTATSYHHDDTAFQLHIGRSITDWRIHEGLMRGREGRVEGSGKHHGDDKNKGFG